MRAPDELRQRLALLHTGGVAWGVSPWLVTVKDRPFAVGTDGRVLVAVERDLVSGECAPAPPPLVKMAPKYIGVDIAPALVVNAGQLKTFAGVSDVKADCSTCNNTGVVECKECDGTGTAECECQCGDVHDADCDECTDGTATCPDCSQPQSIPVGLMGAVIDRKRLSTILETVLPDDSESIRISYDKTKAYVFKPSDGAAWTAVVMSMREGTPIVDKLESVLTT